MSCASVGRLTGLVACFVVSSSELQGLSGALLCLLVLSGTGAAQVRKAPAGTCRRPERNFKRRPYMQGTFVEAEGLEGREGMEGLRGADHISSHFGIEPIVLHPVARCAHYELASFVCSKLPLPVLHFDLTSPSPGPSWGPGRQPSKHISTVTVAWWQDCAPGHGSIDGECPTRQLTNEQQQHFTLMTHLACTHRVSRLRWAVLDVPALPDCSTAS
jgi:hypothetical protein